MTNFFKRLRSGWYGFKRDYRQAAKRQQDKRKRLEAARNDSDSIPEGT